MMNCFLKRMPAAPNELYSEENWANVDLMLSTWTLACSSEVEETTILITVLKPTFETLFSIASIFLGSGIAGLPSPFGESSASFVFEMNLLPADLHLASAGADKICTAAPSPGCILARADVIELKESVASSLYVLIGK